MNSVSYLYPALYALDLDLLPGGTILRKQGRPAGGPTVPPGREERSTDEAGGDRGGHRPERGEDSQARAGALPASDLCWEAAAQSGRRAPLAGVAEPCYEAGGRYPCSATGARHRPRGAGAPVGPRARVGERGTACPAKGIESARNPIACRSSDAPGRSVDRDGGRGTPVDGTVPGKGRPADGGGTDAATCRAAGSLLDKRNRIPSKSWMEDFFRLRTRGEVLHNGRVILSPAGEVLEVCTASRPIFRDTGFDPLPTQKSPASTQKSPASTQSSPESSQKGARRARKDLFLCAACNPDLDTFITFTQAPDRVADRYDYKEAVHRLGVWLDNRVRRKGLKYIFVPELHQDGAIHWHGLCNRSALKLVDSGHRDRKGRTIFNVQDWTVGFSTATLVGEHLAACRYVTKYIAKGMAAGTIGGRYWLHGGQLARPIVHLFDTEQPLPGAAAYDVPEAGLRLWYGVNWDVETTAHAKEEEGMEHEDRIYYAGKDGAASSGHEPGECKGYPAFDGFGFQAERLPVSPLAGPASGWQDMGRIVLHPGWAADWLPDDDPRRYYRLDGVQDGEAPGGGLDREGLRAAAAAMEALGEKPMGIPGEGLEEAPDQTGSMEGPEGGEQDTSNRREEGA